MKIHSGEQPTMSRDEMADDYLRLKLEYTRLHEDYRRLKENTLSKEPTRENPDPLPKKMENYFNNTPVEQIEKDWLTSKQWDEATPPIQERGGETNV